MSVLMVSKQHAVTRLW